MVCDVDSIVITRSILCSVNDNPIVKTGSIVIPKIVIPRFCSINFTITFAEQKIVGRYTGNIIIPKIVKPAFYRTVWNARSRSRQSFSRGSFAQGSLQTSASEREQLSTAHVHVKTFFVYFETGGELYVFYAFTVKKIKGLL